jgi:hypothetical protein
MQTLNISGLKILGASMTTCNKYQISKIILSFKNAFSRYGYSQGE